MDESAIRLYLHSLLETAFPDLKLYYRPPGNLRIERPCIVYEPRAAEPSFSNNAEYITGTRFQVMILSDLPGYGNSRNMFKLPNYGCAVSDNNSYVSSDIVHDVFTVSVNSIS